MLTKKNIEKIIFDSFDEINQNLDGSEKLEKSSKTPIFGYNSSLDSIDFFN